MNLTGNDSAAPSELCAMERVEIQNASDAMSERKAMCLKVGQ